MIADWSAVLNAPVVCVAPETFAIVAELAVIAALTIFGTYLPVRELITTLSVPGMLHVLSKVIAGLTAVITELDSVMVIIIEFVQPSVVQDVEDPAKLPVTPDGAAGVAVAALDAADSAADFTAVTV